MYVYMNIHVYIAVCWQRCRRHTALVFFSISPNFSQVSNIGLSKYWALKIKCRALLTEYRALLSEHTALLAEYRAFWT